MSMRNIPYGRQQISREDIEAIESVLKSDFLTQGPVGKVFEDKIGTYVGANHVVAVNSATSALHLACKALDIGYGDTVWTSPITFVASANCALYCNANVGFVDIDARTGLMSVRDLKDKLTAAEKKGRLPKALIVVHLAGNSCDMRAIYSLTQRYGVKVIEDASHALGASYQGKKVGCCEFSEICIFSFHPVKMITTGEGGAATTNDVRLAQKMRSLRSHGITKDPGMFEEKDPASWHYEQQDLGFNYRMPDINAALGISQIARLDQNIRRRREIDERYRSGLKNKPIRMLGITDFCDSSVHLCIVSLENANKEIHRAKFEQMRQSGIGVQLHYRPVHLNPYFRRLGFKEGMYPNAEKYAETCFSLPVFPGLTNDEIEYVLSVLLLQPVI